MTKYGKTHIDGSRSGGQPVEPVKTLRDEFAMAALTGLLAFHGYGGWGGLLCGEKRAFSIADEMMAERERKYD